MKPIPSIPDHFADAEGHVWRNGERAPEFGNGKGYLRISTPAGTKYVHRLVCEAYHGPCPDGMECRHRNGKRDYNRPENLGWADKATNEADKIIHGTTMIGGRNPQAKLTDAMVLEARARAATGELIGDIAKSFGVGRAMLADAVMGRSWKHLPGALEPFSTRRKFTDDQIREIRERANRETRTALAREFGVTQGAITVIVQRKVYRHV